MRKAVRPTGRLGSVIVITAMIAGCGRPLGATDDPQPGRVWFQNGPVLSPTVFDGAWVAYEIGDCIDAETWLSFEAETRTVIFDRGNFDACMDPADHCKVSLPGSYDTRGGGVLAFDWHTVYGPTRSWHSAGVVDVAQAGQDPRYHLSLYSYWARGGNRWVAKREVGVWSDAMHPAGRVWTETALTLDPAPGDLGRGESGRAAVVLTYRYFPPDGEGDPITGEERFGFDYQIGDRADVGRWRSLTMYTEGEEVYDVWRQLLDDRGATATLPGMVAWQIQRAFNGLLIIDLADPDQLVPYPGYAYGVWFARSEEFNPRGALVCTGFMPLPP